MEKDRIRSKKWILPFNLIKLVTNVYQISFKILRKTQGVEILYKL